MGVSCEARTCGSSWSSVREDPAQTLFVSQLWSSLVNPLSTGPDALSFVTLAQVWSLPRGVHCHRRSRAAEGSRVPALRRKAAPRYQGSVLSPALATLFLMAINWPDVYVAAQPPTSSSPPLVMVSFLSRIRVLRHVLTILSRPLQ